MGLVQLLASADADEAVALLERASDMSGVSAAILSDLAAARLVVAQRQERPLDLVRALEAADAALKIDPRFGPALFNRALALSRLHLRTEALSAWKEVLEREDSDWRLAAEGWVYLLASATPADEWPNQKEKLKEALTKTIEIDTGLIETNIQQVRTFLETDALPMWADATLRADHDLASCMLEQIAQVSWELERLQGDSLLADSIKVIKKASPQKRRRIAYAHRLFRRARELHEAQLYHEAALLFDLSAHALEEEKSPFAFWPVYFRAIISHHSNYLSSRSEFEQLQADPRFPYPIAAAHVSWMLGLTDLRTGRLGDARSHFLSAFGVFTRSQENENRAAMAIQLALTESALGDDDSAWTYRYIGLDGLRHSVKLRRVLNVYSVVARSLDEIDSSVAPYYHSQHVEAARKSESRVAHVIAFAERAQAFVRRGRSSEALNDLSAAYRAVSAISDYGVRSDLQAKLGLVEAQFLMRNGRVKESLVKLEEVIAFAKRLGEEGMLIDGHRLAARANETMGKDGDAEKHYFAALTEVEKQRSRLAVFDERREYLDQTREVTEHLVMFLFDRGRVDDALVALERIRAPVLREMLAKESESHYPRNRAASALKEEVASGTVLLTYLVLPERTLVWALRDGAIDAIEVHVSRDVLEREVRLFSDDMIVGRSVVKQRLLDRSSLHQLSLQTITAGAERVVVIPDEPLFGLPFERLLPVQSRHGGVALAPGINAYLDLKTSHGLARSEGPSILFVSEIPARAEFPELLPLPAWHPQPESMKVRKLLGNQATVAAVLDLLPRHDIFVFRGHAIGLPERPNVRGLMLSAEGSDDGILLPEEIRIPGHLQTRLAVLLGCSTASGEVSRTEGLLGLAWSLLAAGVRTVVVSEGSISASEADKFLEGLVVELDRNMRQARDVRDRGVYESSSALGAGRFVVHGEPLQRLWEEIRVPAARVAAR